MLACQSVMPLSAEILIFPPSGIPGGWEAVLCVFVAVTWRWFVFQSLNVPDTQSVSPSKSTKVGKKYGLSKHTSKVKERKTKDRLVVSLLSQPCFCHFVSCLVNCQFSL